MSDDALYITNPGALTRFGNELGRFAGNVRECLTLIDTQLRASLDTLAYRESRWHDEVRDRQEAYDRADEEDRTSAYRALEEAQGCLRDVRHWQDQLRTAAEQYRRRALETHDLLDQQTPKAQGALQEHTNLLYAYLAMPAPDGGGTSNFSTGGTGAASPAPGQVLVSGFERSPLCSDAAVYALLKDAIPAAHLDPETLMGISFVDRERPHGEGRFIVGETFPVGDHERIEIYIDPTGGENGPEQSMRETIAHEIGHHCHNDLDRRDRLHWIAWDGMHRNTPRRLDCFVSEYAMTNSSEDFAECYSSYIFQPKLLAGRNPQKYQLLRDHVFAGREYK